MSEPVGVMISQSLNLCLGYAERLLKGISSEQFARFASVGEEVVNSNHPAFVLGHLSLYPAKILEQLGHDASSVAVPESFQTVFSKDATCQDDPEGTIYPTMDEIVEKFFQGYRLAAEKLQSAEDPTFQQPNPNEGKIKEAFPTLGAMHMFYVSGHMMVHLGQMSAWRRMQGLGSA